jgi:nicotinamidase-related amidase
MGASGSALLVVDVQEGLVAKKLYEKERFLGAIRVAIEEFRKSRGLVVFVRHDGAVVRRGTPGWELYFGLDRLDDDPIIDKARGNAFDGTGLARLLEERRIGRVVVCGLVTHGCVRATCLGALALGLRAALLEGGHSNWAADAAARIGATEGELAGAGVKTVALGRILEE